MNHNLEFYIDGQWVNPAVPDTIDVINPATEQAFVQISAGSAEDVDRAVAAARAAFTDYSRWTKDQKIELLENILTGYRSKREDMAEAISREMGSPVDRARSSQTRLGEDHFIAAIANLKQFKFETMQDDMIIRHEPVGVCGLITPWNWPLNQIAAKVAPALAAGCCMILKPSEEAPINAMILAEVLHDAGVPAGVFNLINGYGPVVGESMSRHPGIDMMSFTGSTRGGIAVARASADTVKRVGQELGGKSANIILSDTDIKSAVARGVAYCMDNTGQSCNAPTRMLVPMDKMDEALDAAREAAVKIAVNDPSLEGNHLGPVVNKSQFEKIQSLIQQGIDEGATLVAGGTGRPDHLDHGYYCKPTVFGNVTNDMVIAREEIFGPVISILGYEDEDQAIEIANDSDFGLAGYVSSGDIEHAKSVARQLRAGQIAINYKAGNANTPFGGYKQSGNGREKGRWGLHEFLEVKAITGF